MLPQEDIGMDLMKEGKKMLSKFKSNTLIILKYYELLALTIFFIVRACLKVTVRAITSQNYVCLRTKFLADIQRITTA